MAYKKLIKVSNVCQLLDKSKYPATQTDRGITFTNNGDGTITVNGTATGNAQFLVRQSIHCKDNHKYLVKGSPSGGGYGLYRITTSVYEDGSYVTGFSDSGSGNISNALLGSYTITVFIDIYKGQTVSNLVFKPQIFDLTEMYGAGNEPTTVEEFRKDFPEEMYDYSPHCWLTSYKRVFMTSRGNYLTSYQRNLTCKTKNLFDYSKVNNLMYIGGYSINQYLIKNGNKFTVMYPMSKGATYLDYIMPLKAGTYTLSLLAYGTVSGAKKGYFGLVKVENDYKVLKYNKYAKIWLSSNARQSYTLTIEEDGNYAVYAYSDYANSTNIDCTFWDIQLELGDTATDYVPYGHL